MAVLLHASHVNVRLIDQVNCVLLCMLQLVGQVLVLVQ